MRTLVLGGTAWLGRTLATTAVGLGHDVTCLARGSSPFPPGVREIRADRGDPLPELGEQDLVVDVARQPGQVRRAVGAVRAGRYVLVSTGNVYLDHATLGADETAAVREPLDGDALTGMELYGEAKVACEHAVVQAFPDSHLLARSGLIAGPGDDSGRTTYWPWRFARNAGHPVLVPDAPDFAIGVVDVRDLAHWLLTTDAVGAIDAVGPVLPLAEHLAVARAVGGHTGPLAARAADWLAERKVDHWMGPRSLPLWIPDPQWVAFGARSGAAARAAGLVCRPLAETLADGLAALDGPPASGLTDDEERALLSEPLR